MCRINENVSGEPVIIQCLFGRAANQLTGYKIFTTGYDYTRITDKRDNQSRRHSTERQASTDVASHFPK